MKKQLSPDHVRMMEKALVLARKAARAGEVPIGAVLVHEGTVIASSYNLTRTKHDPTAHAEIVVLQRGSKILKNERLLDSVLYVTKEPCVMCAGAIVQARVPTVVFGAPDPKTGACGGAFKILPNKKLNHRPAVIKGVLREECAQLLVDFFKKRRAK
jgi:tRNA(adenine34) deaminase